MRPEVKVALEKIIHTHRVEGRLGACEGGTCAYHDACNRVCAIGALLTPEQHELLDEVGWNYETPIETILQSYEVEGKFDNIKALSQGFAQALQNWHDEAVNGDAVSLDEVVDCLELVLNGEALVMREWPNNRHGGKVDYNLLDFIQ